jgi:broad specificity phosphatase PhoE
VNCYLQLPTGNLKAFRLLRIYLARHGETVWNRESRFQGHTDVPLSPEGERQAERLAERLSRLKLDAIWTSDMCRASKTAAAIALQQGPAPITTPLLRETMLGEWEGLTEPEIIARGDKALFKEYRANPIENRPPGGERLEHVWQRVLSVRDRIREIHQRGNVVIVGHGGSMKSIIVDALGAELAAMRRIYLENASLSMVEYDGDRVWVKLVNDTSHLQQDEG